METIWHAVPIVLTLAGLEILLSADNAVVLAALAHGLPKEQRNKALFYGLIGAFVLRFIAIVCAQWIIKYWFLQIIGAVYLIWLGAAHITDPKGGKHDEDPHSPSFKAKNFWGVVVAIELTDLAFAVDSVLAAVAMSQNLWIIYIGAIIGLVAMRFAASGVLKILDVFPQLTTYAYAMVLWIGIKLGWHGMSHIFVKYGMTEKMPTSIFWLVMLVIIILASLHGYRSFIGKKSIQH